MPVTSDINSATSPKQIRLTDLPGVTLWQGPIQRPPFNRHVHLSYHVGMVFKGAQKFWHKGAKHYLCGQSVATINPDEVHDGRSATPEDYHVGVLQFTPEILQAIFNDNRPRYFDESISQNAHQAQQLAHILQHFRAEPEAQTLLAESVQLLIGDLLQTSAEAQCTAFENSKAIHQIRAQIKTQALEAPCTPLPLRTLAEAHHISEYKLIRQFKKAFGITPYAYQLCVRLEAAKTRLDAGQAIIDVASAMGFTDQSHFTRQFKRAFCSTPAQYLHHLQ